MATTKTARRGFTLIELLIVVVIIGILAAIAIPKFAATKDKAKLASIKSDLRNIMTAQEAYYFDFSTYAGTLDPNVFVPTVGNTITITPAAGTYAATGTNSTITSGFTTCTVTVGTSTAVDSRIICS